MGTLLVVMAIGSAAIALLIIDSKTNIVTNFINTLFEIGE
jgi:hypothetical protein